MCAAANCRVILCATNHSQEQTDLGMGRFQGQLLGQILSVGLFQGCLTLKTPVKAAMGRPKTGPVREIFAFQQMILKQQIKQPPNMALVLWDGSLMVLHARGDRPLSSQPSCAHVSVSEA